MRAYHALYAPTVFQIPHGETTVPDLEML